MGKNTHTHSKGKLPSKQLVLMCWETICVHCLHARHLCESNLFTLLNCPPLLRKVLLREFKCLRGREWATKRGRGRKDGRDKWCWSSLWGRDDPPPLPLVSLASHPVTPPRGGDTSRCDWFTLWEKRKTFWSRSRTPRSSSPLAVGEGGWGGRTGGAGGVVWVCLGGGLLTYLQQPQLHSAKVWALREGKASGNFSPCLSS